MLITDGHADTGVGIHHLLCRDDLDLVGVGIQSIELGDPGYLLMINVQQVEVPVRAIVQRCDFSCGFYHMTSLTPLAS